MPVNARSASTPLTTAHSANLTTLAPDIVADILDDALPNHITLFDLAVDPPAVWADQWSRVRSATGHPLPDDGG